MGTKRIKNVIMLTVDALRYDRLGFSGYPMKNTPAIDYLAANGINCVNAFTHGSLTHFAFPSIFTSTLPLDHNGYDRGIKGRGTSFVEALKDKGFYTAGFATVHWIGKFFSYDRGFDEFYQVFGMDVFWKNIKSVFLAHLIKLEEKGIISEEEFQVKACILIKEAVGFTLNYLDETKKYPRDLLWNRHPNFYNYTRIRKILLNELEYLKGNKCSKGRIDCLYFNLLKLNCVSYEWAKLKIKGRSLKDELFLGKMKIKSGIKRSLERKHLIKRNQYQFPPAKRVGKILTNWLDNNQNKPFFVWAHLFDIHSDNFTTGPMQLPPIFSIFKDRVKAGSKYYGDTTYDASVKYVDRQIAKIIDYLKEKNLLDETLIVIASDHGRNAGAPYRSYSKMLSFYEEFIKVPLIFYNPHLNPKTISGLSGLVDIAPTIFEILGLPRVSEFDGLSLVSPEGGIDKRDHLVLEHTFKGVCDIKNKPIYISVRTKRYKYSWKEYTADNDNSGTDKIELFDLKNDSTESVNKKDAPEYKIVRDNLHRIAMNRFKKIRNNGGEKLSYDRA